jgi:hypothetical protein
MILVLSTKRQFWGDQLLILDEKFLRRSVLAANRLAAFGKFGFEREVYLCFFDFFFGVAKLLIFSIIVGLDS